MSQHPRDHSRHSGDRLKDNCPVNVAVAEEGIGDYAQELDRLQRDAVVKLHRVAMQMLLNVNQLKLHAAQRHWLQKFASHWRKSVLQVAFPCAVDGDDAGSCVCLHRAGRGCSLQGSMCLFCACREERLWRHGCE